MLRLTLANFVLPSLFFLSGAHKELDKLWVIDTDAGADDGFAISAMLRAEALWYSVKVLAITTLRGNTQVDNVARNVLKILDTANRLDIPVYKGSNDSLLVTPPSDNFFGNDGFGDFPYPNPPSEEIIKHEHAVSYLTRVVSENPGKINLLAIGPLTNVALAIRLDRHFLNNIGRIVILGGSVEGQGNIKPGIEFNFYSDPEAAFIVWNETWRINVLGKIDSPLIRLLNLAESVSGKRKEDRQWQCSDLIAALWALNETKHKESKLFGSVEISGATARGATFIDYTSVSHKFQQINIMKPGSLNASLLQNTLMHLFSNDNP